jgi:hypothetical protein
MRKKLLTSLLVTLLAVGMPQAFAIYDTWNAIATSDSWQVLACSTNCEVIVAGASTKKLSISRDGGGTWSQLTNSPALNWSGLALSSDGVVIVGAETSGSIRISFDSGGSWSTLSSAGTAFWRGLDISADGTKIVASVQGGSIWSSSNSGSTWVEQTSAGTSAWKSIDMTADGSVVVVASTQGPIMRGTGTFGSWSWTNTTDGKTSIASDSGPTQELLTAKGWKQVILDTTGNYIAAVATDVFISANGGTTWVRASQGNYSYIGIAGTSDLKTVLVAVSSSCGSNCRPRAITTTNFTSFTNYAGLGSYDPGYSAIVMAKNGIRAVVSASAGTLYMSGSVITTGTVSLSVGQGTFRTNSPITATLYPISGGRITYYANGKKIAGCISRVASGSSHTCNWLPSVRGAVTITAVFTPTDTAATKATGSTATTVNGRSNKR